MKKLIYLISMLLLLIGCSKSDNETKKTSYPECISSQIEGILKTPVQIPRANVKKYTYLGKTVYAVNYVMPDDKSTSIYDEDCKLICGMGANIEGTPFDTCVEWNKAIYIETVWTDPR
jgi:hypothetical protein